MKDNTAQIIAQVPVDVATFLLNEKRAEIHTIEARFKVNVLLVPNTYLETPNYKVTRLRHDDLNQGEPMPASFNMSFSMRFNSFSRSFSGIASYLLCACAAFSCLRSSSMS